MTNNIYEPAYASWREELDDPFVDTSTQSGGSITSVVQAFIDNKANFESENVRAFVNSALQNEICETARVYSEKQDALKNTYDRILDKESGDLEERLHKYGWDSDKIQDHLNSVPNSDDYQSIQDQVEIDYDDSRRDILDAVSIVMSNNDVDIDRNTWEYLQRIDTDSMIKDHLGKTLTELQDQHSMNVFTGSVPMTASREIDFSKESVWDKESGVFTKERLTQKDLPERGREKHRDPAILERNELSGKAITTHDRGMGTAGGAVAAFMRSHGRNPDGTKIESKATGGVDWDREMG